MDGCDAPLLSWIQQVDVDKLLQLLGGFVVRVSASHLRSHQIQECLLG